MPQGLHGRVGAETGVAIFVTYKVTSSKVDYVLLTCLVQRLRTLVQQMIIRHFLNHVNAFNT